MWSGNGNVSYLKRKEISSRQGKLHARFQRDSYPNQGNDPKGVGGPVKPGVKRLSTKLRGGHALQKKGQNIAVKEGGEQPPP